MPLRLGPSRPQPAAVPAPRPPTSKGPPVRGSAAASLSLALLALAGSALPLSAQSPTPKPPDALTRILRTAECVAEVTIERETARWGPEGRVIWTDWSARILSVHKGPKRRRITLSEPGGIVGIRGQWAPHRPRHRVGETLLVFLQRDALRQWRVVDGHRGRFRIGETLSGRPAVLFDLRHTELVGEVWPRRPGSGPRRGVARVAFLKALKTRRAAGDQR